MTAVVSSPSVQSGPRLGWYTSGNGGQGALSSMNADEVSRMFMPRKSVQRSNSSSSLSSDSSTSTVSATPQVTNAGQNGNADPGAWSSKKKTSRSIWPSTKAEPVSGVTNARSQALPVLSSGPSATSAMSVIHQPSPIVPSQHMIQSSQQNNIRPGVGPSGDPPALLTLIPINGTFDRKQISVPYFPDILRVGRQTNAKTVPTPSNGYFDSKVLSRQHAEIWADKSGKIWIRDVKSSNGTFVNGQRLSPENRESEPHELRENDTLELGIDIVSEDQKTIVHHKVSAKVEHAGPYGTSPNILDLNFGDLDPSSGGGLLPSPLSQPLSHFRGRAGSTMSNRSASSVASSQINAMHQQRQMNYWNSPVTVEQVVKRLMHEMKQAKQQAHDLRQTDEFLTTIIKPGSPEKEKSRPSPVLVESNGAPRVMNGRPKLPRVDSLSRFSDPPAPPPQQPLPEKPDAVSPLKRSDTEKPKVPSCMSPVSRESSQILSLIEALSSAKRELDSQSTRVLQLENMLHKERVARKWAEEKARKLEMQSDVDEQEAAAKASSEPPTETEQDKENILQTRDISTEADDLAAPDTISKPQDLNDISEQPSDRRTAQLQQSLDAVMEEMQGMRRQLEEYRKRAEKAEGETIEARQSLAEMIETLQRERLKTDGSTRDRTALRAGGDIVEHAETLLLDDGTEVDAKTLASMRRSSHSLTQSQPEEIERAATAIGTQRHKYKLLEESGPYASMLGVVLLGVGLMAYLNGWQKLDK